MDEKDLLSWTARRMGLARFPEELWSLIPKEVREVAQDDGEKREGSLLPCAERLLEAARFVAAGLDLRPDHPSGPKVRKEQEPIEVEVREYERQRAAAYSEYRAKLASDSPWVMSCRQRNLGGEDLLLGPEKIRQLLTDSPELHYVSELLAWDGLWTVEQAVRFVLTEEVPKVSPISGRIIKRFNRAWTRGTIMIEADPWISPEVVTKTYARAQKRVLGQNNRRLSNRNLYLLRFVLSQVERIHEADPLERDSRRKNAKGKDERSHTELVGVSWRGLMERWNKHYPENHDWRYDEVRNFSRDFRNAERSVAYPVRE